ncbi:hypothetical protein UFOVP399_53 [uncultured Caudovirales phage]|uniref:Uncharacterized protein n=1 Tax=uncultured Caudovirales phage TaxID=2100421 RepID=A0A6J5M671_9CAUD|nr:hypothetical protein UFOVP399_53 [uncultured Caudovirales phage]
MTGSYDRHRALEEAYRIEWRGKRMRYSPEFATQIMLAKDVLSPDGPFSAMMESVQCVVGTEVLTLGRDEIDQILELALQASVRGMQVINQAKAKTEGTP